MKVLQFKVDGFRSLKHTDVRGIASKSVFHGDNGSGKSNLILALEVIFQSKVSDPGRFRDDSATGDSPPSRPTPFWKGQILDFSENFYMGGHGPITFEVFLSVTPSFFAGLDENNILTSLKKQGHDFTVKLKGQITHKENDGVMMLEEVYINGKLAMRQKKGGPVWMPHISAPNDTKQRVVENVLDTFNNQVKVIPASRFLSEETFSVNETPLHSQSYKNWLHKMSLGRDEYKIFKCIKEWLASEKFNLGEISFAVDNKQLEVMVEDKCGYRMKVDHKGSGIQQILVLLGYIAESNAAIIGVEEPELNLSFKNQDLIVNILREMVENSNNSLHQILVTSHSDHVGSREDLKRYHVEKVDGTDTVVRKFTRNDRVALFPRTNRIS